MKKQKRSLILQFNVIYISIILILVPAIVSFFYFHSRRILLNVITADMTNLIEKSVQISDAKLLSAKEYALGFLTDADTKKIIENIYKCESDYEYYLYDSKLKSQIDKYFLASSDIYSVNIVSGKYAYNITYGENYYPKGTFVNSDICKKITDDWKSLLWIPTYKFHEMYGQKGFEKLVDLDYYYMFSMARNLEALYGNYDGGPCNLALIVNFINSFWDDVFSENSAYKNMIHLVVDSYGNIITHSDREKIGETVSNDLVEKLLPIKHGAVFETVDGSNMILFSCRSDVTGWFSIYALEEKSLMTPYFIMIIRYGTIVIAVILFSLILFSLLLKKTVVSPVIHLEKEVQKIKQDPQYKIEEKGCAEICNLIHTYNDLNTSIQNLGIKNLEMQMKEINLQLNPHFIYNILNMMNLEFIRDGDDKHLEMLEDVIFMMRYVLNSELLYVDFETDLKYTKHYINLMNKRYKGKFQTDYDIDETLNKTIVPKFMLQPLVENVYKHAFSDVQGHMYHIEIKCRLLDGKRIFSVIDDGAGMDKDTLEKINTGQSNTIGIKNTRERVRFMYGENATLCVESQKEKGTCASIILPLE